MLENDRSEIQEIDKTALSFRDKYINLKLVLERNCKELTEEESLQFPSLFSRLVFISQKYELPKSLEWRLQDLRIKANSLLKDDKNLVFESEYRYAKETLELFFSFLRNENRIEDSFLENEISPQTQLPLNKLRVQVLELDKLNKIILCQADASVSSLLKVKYNVPAVNDIFDETVDHLWIGAQLNLIDIKVDDLGYYIPQSIVLEPDYLIDASAIAECFQSYGYSYLHYFRRKFEPNVNTHFILLGNLANFFLDELIYAESPANLTFEDTFLKSFHQMPFEYASCPEIQELVAFRDFMDKARRHFDNIKRVVLGDMSANGFDVSLCILEPSFFCEKYGFQGRLDLLQASEVETGVDRIIELKSGKPPYPREDVSKIAPNHEAQTIVYRLMIESVFNKDARHIYPTILYSSVDNKKENLRFVATFRQLEKKIINTRNLIVAMEHDLYIGGDGAVEKFFHLMFDSNSYGQVPQFFSDKLTNLEKIIKKSTVIERTYFYRFVSFVTRELYIQKVGDGDGDCSMSMATLWNSPFLERKDALELLVDLEIEDIDDSGRGMTILFHRNDEGDCVNFREGEICVLYPKEKDSDTVLTNQILKGTVMELSRTHILLKFRYKQKNKTFFSRYQYWAVEHDKLDHSYNAMYKSLFSFLSATSSKKELLLGLRKPISKDLYIGNSNISKEEKQRDVINKALAAEDFFLIVGPPGTGKTSMFARQLIERFYADENVNILVMAYTNRAVDELCMSISQAFDEDRQGCDKYIRIGSELSCGEAYRHRLLQNISDGAKDRKEILTKINTTRIFVGTLASITGKPELFDLKKFNVAIIDEASQILEPQIIGLLPLFDKFIMIGDHKQLSTITLQDENKSKVSDKLLNEIELYDCRESLFERLYRVASKKGWYHVYDTLTYHGRMHEDISSLVNIPFYDGILKVATERQTEPLIYSDYDKSDNYQTLIASKRVAFISVRGEALSNLSNKINIAEADEAVALSMALVELYKANNLNFDPNKTLGIITPYRNQIAVIKHKLEETGIPQLKSIMVDTVERYQGSQRDIIILSFCFNKPYQLNSFCNMDRDGRVDRKLNVALTRAREQLFLIGNDLILNKNTIYSKILNGISQY